jgi:MmyB-like transcription regulator ligand binding domain
VFVDLPVDLCRLSPEFAGRCGATTTEGVKHIRHPIAGPIAFEYSAFAVDGRPDLGIVIYNPATPADTERIRLLIRSQPETSKKTV